MILDWHSRAAAIKAALLKLPLLPGTDALLELAAENLAYPFDVNPRAGFGSPAFRQVSPKNALKELLSFRAQAKRLQKELKYGRETAKQAATRLGFSLSCIHQTTILALANVGFLARPELAALCDRVALKKSTVLSEPDNRLLQRAIGAAERARQSISAPESERVAHRGPPSDRRAMAAATILASYFRQLTDRRPGITVDASKLRDTAAGDFLVTLRAVFEILNIDGSAEVYARKVIRTNHPRRIRD